MNSISTEESPGLAARAVGADGVVGGVADTELDASPEPTEFTARNEISYSVPLVRPLIVTGEPVTSGSNATQEPPSS